jgi:hypothetical protein
LAIDVGLDTAAISNADVFNIVGNLDNFDTKFMARNSRITKKGHFSKVSAVVGAAYADGFNTNESLARLQVAGLCNLNH